MGKAHRITITADVLKALPSRMFGEVGEVAVVGVLERGFPGRLAVFVDGNGPESGGCNVLDQVQANRWTVCDAKSLWLKSLPPLRFESVQTAFVPKTHSDTGLFLLLKAAELSREWQREIVVVQLDVKKAFDHVDHRAAFKAMKLQGVSLFSMALIAAIWEWKLYEGMLGNGDVKQSSDESRIASRSAGISSHLHDDHGIGAERPDKELDNTETCLEAVRLCAGCDLLCGRRGAGHCIDVCFRK